MTAPPTHAGWRLTGLDVVLEGGGDCEEVDCGPTQLSLGHFVLSHVSAKLSFPFYSLYCKSMY